MICIVGKSGSGKSELCNALTNKGYNKVITYTTRPPRDGEVDGVDYHFVDDEYFTEHKNDFLETATYRGWQYGSMKKDFHEDSVAVLTPAGMRKLQLYYTVDDTQMDSLATVLLVAPRKDRLVKLIETRDDIDEVLRREQTEVGQFDGVDSEVDFVLSNDYETTPAKLASILLEAVDEYYGEKEEGDGDDPEE